MDLKYVKGGLPVKTIATLEQHVGIPKKYSAGRKPGALGVVEGFFPGSGGDVWAVKHEDGTIAAYIHTEFDDMSPDTKYDDINCTD